MNQHPISPDDPRLTAYALNEMELAERVEFEQLLNQDPAAQKWVDEIRATGTSLVSALEDEPAPIKASLLEGSARHGGLIRFPQFYYMVSGLAAACFAVFFVYWQREQAGLEKRKYVEVDIAAFQAARAAAEANRKAMAVAPTGLDQAVVSAPMIQVDSSPKVETLEERDRPLELTPMSIAAAEEETFLGGTGYAGAQVKAGGGLGDLAAPMPAAAKRMAFGERRQNYVSPAPEFNTEAYGHRKDNEYQRVADHPLSTFSIDVDTASYANVRRFLAQGQRPPADAVRIEELINYFPYRYAPPVGNVPFAAHLEVASAPWAPAHRLVRIGLKGREVTDAARPPANLVFLLDVSGSMQAPNKLPLVKQSLRLLVNKLRPDDRVAIAVYAGASGLALPSTPASRKGEILAAIDRLEASGSTNGALGIHLAYDIAKANFVSGGVNRVLLATDGDFNVGTTSEGELVRLVGEKAKSGVFLSVLGFGMGNLKDGMLEQIADKGNGNYAYIDSVAEARKALVEQAGGTLVTIAKDVKIQVEFNPAQVAAYRLIGYENRLLAKEDFNNDAVDAGEIGAGHTVTALYEIVPAGAELPGEATATDALKYQPVSNSKSEIEIPTSAELLTVKIRYKEPSGDVSSRLEFALSDSGTRFEDASQDFQFAAAVAGFGMALRDSPHKGSLTLAAVSAWGRGGVGSDVGGYRSDFLGLVQQAEASLH